LAPKSDPIRRTPASRPGKGGPAVRRRRFKPSSKPSVHAGRGSKSALQGHVVEPIKRQAAESVEMRAEQRLGFTARRAAVLAAVVCVLTLTIAGPVRTYFAQRTEMQQLSASEAALRRQIADLEQKKGELADPAYIAAQARERLGFVMPGDIPFQVQLPPTAAASPQPGDQTGIAASHEPWYTALWHTIADAPHLPPAPPSEIPPAPAQPATPGSEPPATPNLSGPGG
jgi:cell division protein FtsB